jgi:hypothetical protein
MNQTAHADFLLFGVLAVVFEDALEHSSTPTDTIECEITKTLTIVLIHTFVARSFYIIFANSFEHPRTRITLLDGHFTEDIFLSFDLPYYFRALLQRIRNGKTREDMKI